MQQEIYPRPTLSGRLVTPSQSADKVDILGGLGIGKTGRVNWKSGCFTVQEITEQRMIKETV